MWRSNTNEGDPKDLLVFLLSPVSELHPNSPILFMRYEESHENQHIYFLNFNLNSYPKPQTPYIEPYTINAKF